MNTTLRDTHLQYDATTPPMLLHSNEYTVWKKKLNLFLRITTVSKDKLAITVFNRIDPSIIDLMTLFDESLILDNTPVTGGIFPDAQNTKGLEYLGDTLEQYFKHDSFLESKRLLDDITQFKRLPDESYRACSERFRQLYSTYQKYSCTLSEVQLTQFFMNGLRLSQSDEHSLRTHLNYVHKLTSTSDFTLKAMTDSIDTLFSYIPAVSKPDNLKSEANVVGTGKGKGKGKSSRFGGKSRSKGKSNATVGTVSNPTAKDHILLVINGSHTLVEAEVDMDQTSRKDLGKAKVKAKVRVLAEEKEKRKAGSHPISLLSI